METFRRVCSSAIKAIDVVMPMISSVPGQHRRKRLLTVGHSYVVRANRQLAEGIQASSNGEWDVTVAAPKFYKGNPRYGDMKPGALQVGTDEGVKVVGVPMILSSRVHFAVYGLELRTLMASGFDAIHCWEEPFMLSASQVALWAPREAVVTCLTFQNIEKNYPPPFNWLERRVLRRLDGWIAGGRLVQEALKDRPAYVDRPSRIIGLGIDPNLYQTDLAARRRLHESFNWTHSSVPIVGFVGRFTAAKGLSLLMRVLDTIKVPWRALFVGNGVLEAELRSWSRKYADRVEIITDASHEDVPAHLNAMDLLIVPSQTMPNWHEQFGRVLIEAFACGTCVVASDSGEIPDVVGEAGLIVSESNEQLWRDTIGMILENPALRSELVKRGHARVSDFFTWAALGSRYVEFFNELDVVRRKSTRSCAAF